MNAWNEARLVGRTGQARLGAVTLVVVAMLAGVAVAGNDSDARAINVQVLQNTPERVVLQYQLGEFDTVPVAVDGQRYHQVLLGREAQRLEAGAPDVPWVCRSIVIPDAADMEVNVLEASHYDVVPFDVAPSKGNLLRTVNPDDVPYVLGDEYTEDAFYPEVLAALREPYILRDVRGVVVELNPFQYNPVTRTLRVYTDVTLEVVATGRAGTNVLTHRPAELSLAFHQLYGRHFLNYAPSSRYVPLDEEGQMLIIAHDVWIPNVQPLAAHKTAHGVATTIVGVSTIGNNATSIKNYIQNVYNTSDLAFVLLVGDSAQVATPSASGGAADPTYGLLAGSDSYPDAMIGRFSAESAAHVDTQVLRTIEYETMNVRDTAWFWRGCGIASNQGPGHFGEYDNQHMDFIRADLLAYGYTSVDQIYDPSGTAAMVSNALNAGRGIVNYCGHGSTTSWGSTGFSNSNVAALQNDNMLPFICSVACVNGQFNGYTCFGEAWLRSTRNGEPIGAIGAYMSSINQSWNPPMDAQDEFVDMYVAESYARLGTLLFAGSCRMIDLNGSGGVSMFNTWHLFGDPSLVVLNLGPTPPSAASNGFTIPWNTSLTVGLEAGDDGLPNPPGALTYIITALPARGTLSDPGAGVIQNVPYALVGGGNQVVYQPHVNQFGADSFQFKANDGGTPPEGGDSNTATISIEIVLPDVEKVFDFPLNSDPGWSTEGDWAFGVPMGGGSHNCDPTAGYTGSNVYGYNLSGDYASFMSSVQYLTAGPLNCSNKIATELRFRRWLGVERQPFDRATLEASNDGVNWVLLWGNGTTTISESSWSLHTFDISAVADNQPTVYIRWGMGPTDGTITYPGWNIDDVEIWAAFSLPPPLHILASNPPDGAIDARRPTNPGTLGPQGWDQIEVTFDGAAGAVDSSKFVLQEVCLAGNCDGVAPAVSAVAVVGNTATLTLNRPIDPKAWTKITFTDGDAGDVIRLGFLPGDADGSGTANANDVVAVVNNINLALGGGSPPVYHSDIDRSGTVGVSDMLTLINVLNGAAPFEVYFGKNLPPMP
ncbi:MAG TPA: C25 family cysteine peptidase [Phycisphaerae bacterium]|nr:C25 family cysteine peptidase [Phycisphaerae bacterium]HNU46672.1 C25 family cysteine peptidase [Phycisphaerae bacterium]